MAARFSPYGRKGGMAEEKKCKNIKNSLKSPQSSLFLIQFYDGADAFLLLGSNMLLLHRRCMRCITMIYTYKENYNLIPKSDFTSTLTRGGGRFFKRSLTLTQYSIKSAENSALRYFFIYDKS